MFVKGLGGMTYCNSKPFSTKTYIIIQLAMAFRYFGVRHCGRAARYLEKKVRGW